VLIFGPGKLALDTVVAKRLGHRPHPTQATVAA
jgi:hypothetical protein